VEWTRAAVSASVVQPYLTNGATLSPLVLRPSAERLLREAYQRGEGGIGSLALDPATTRVFVEAVAQALERRGPVPGRPCVLSSQDLRPHVRRVLSRAFPHLAVLSFAEIPSSITLTSNFPVEVAHAYQAS
jgi:flagellar biosynthesis protein FlhA